MNVILEITKMNIAIIIAVSNYTNKANELPASKKDGEVIGGILNATKKFDRVLTINDNESSSKTKELLSNFFIEHKGVKIDELFFYYSGHGEFSNDEFYYLLPDFDLKKKNQTSLQNNEVDDLIRTLNPQIVIKVIDACQSGTSYIKESDVLTKYFNETKKGFNKCYFLNSSLSNQSSYQDDNLSFFTYSFVQALKDHPTSEIRYKDIIDFILDEFDGNQEQTPFFVIQAELTEKFCSFNDEVKTYLESYNSQKNTTNEEKKVSTLLEIVRNNAKEYVDKEGALKALEFCKVQFDKLVLDKDIKDLYDVEINFTQENNNLTGVKTIGKWLKDNPNDFFAKPYYGDYYDHDLGDLVSFLSGYELLVEDVPFKAVSIELLGKFPNIKSYQSNIAILISKRELTFFYTILQYVENSWESKSLDTEKIKWTYTNSKIANNKSISNGLKQIYVAINDRIKSDIQSQFGLKSEEDDDLPF